MPLFRNYEIIRTIVFAILSMLYLFRCKIVQYADNERGFGTRCFIFEITAIAGIEKSSYLCSAKTKMFY